jgi:hypothetical protein
MIQGQGPGPGEPPDDSAIGLGRPLFAFDCGPGDPGYWMNYDNPQADEPPLQAIYFSFDAEADLGFDQGLWYQPAPAGLDHAPLFYPGAHPIDPDFVPTYLTFDGNDPASGFDQGWWTPPMRPLYLEFDSVTEIPPLEAIYFWFDAEADLGFDQGLWYQPAVPEHGLDAGEWYTPGQYWPPPWDPDQLPPTGVTWPPITLAGFDLGAFGVTLTPAV